MILHSDSFENRSKSSTSASFYMVKLCIAVSNVFTPCKEAVSRSEVDPLIIRIPWLTKSTDGLEHYIMWC